MEDATVKVKKKNKTGPLKSSPGFLKCMRNVYLYFKEEKEKGALNIPINSFIERTAVACGVGRKTLYNYAKKGLFDEHPTLLQPKQKKKRGKRKLKQEDIQIAKKGKKKSSPTVENNAGPSSNPPYSVKKEPLSPRLAKNAMIQTDPRPMNSNENLVIHTSNPTNAPDGFTNFIVNRDQNKVPQVQVVQQNKVLTGPWTTGPTTVKRDVDYFSKNNIWHAVYNLHTTAVLHLKERNGEELHRYFRVFGFGTKFPTLRLISPERTAKLQRRVKHSKNDIVSATAYF